MDGITHPISRLELREIARKFRQIFKLTNLYVNVKFLIEVINYFFPKCFILIVPDDEWSEDFPSLIEKENDSSYVIKIKDSVYERACKGSGGDRMHIIHEIAHYILINECGYAPLTARSYGDIKVKYTPSSIEWQAKALAGEILMDYEMTKNMSLQEISIKCGVSIQAAAKRLDY